MGVPGTKRIKTYNAAGQHTGYRTIVAPDAPTEMLTTDAQIQAAVERQRKQREADDAKPKVSGLAAAAAAARRK